MGGSEADAKRAFKAAVAAQEAFRSELRAKGAEMLRKIEDDPDSTGVVLFGRPYNAFAPEANKSIPAKFASPGVTL